MQCMPLLFYFVSTVQWKGLPKFIYLFIYLFFFWGGVFRLDPPPPPPPPATPRYRPVFKDQYILLKSFPFILSSLE